MSAPCEGRRPVSGRRASTLPTLRSMTLLVTGLATGLTACQSAATRLFTLEPLAPSGPHAPMLAGTGTPVRVDAVHLPPALDRQELMTSSTPGEFKIRELDQWSAPLSDLARQTLTADLSLRLSPGQVIFPHLPKPAGALGITVDVLELSADARGAVLQASWLVASADAAKDSHRAFVTLHAAASRDEDPATAAHVLSTLLAELADRIVADLPAPPSGTDNGTPHPL